MTLTIVDRTNVEKARLAIEEYRKAVAELHKTKYDPVKRAQLFGKLMTELGKNGYTYTSKTKPEAAIGKFFTESKIYNVEDLGFNDLADFEDKATVTDITNLKEMWK